MLQEAITKLIDDVEGVYSYEITSELYMKLYTIVYTISNQNPLGPESQKLYDYYKKTHEDYISSKILPSLAEKEDENFLEELVESWKKYKKLTYWLLRFFHYLERYFVPKKDLPTMKETSFSTFYESVYGEVNDKVKNSVIFMINEERNGKSINQALVKSVLEIYIDLANGSMKFYRKDFQESMLENTSAFYHEKASMWIEKDSHNHYMLKVEGCLKQEKERGASYLQHMEIDKLLKVVEHELLCVHASKLGEKKQLEI